MSLNVRCGSGTMIHMDELGFELSGFGRETFPGLRRVWEVMWCFVVRISHIGSTFVGEGDKELETARMFFFSETNMA